MFQEVSSTPVDNGRSPMEWFKMGNLARFVICKDHFAGSVTNGLEKVRLESGGPESS